MVLYPTPHRSGTDAVLSFGDGTTILVKWFQAEHITPTNKIGYNIYYSTVREAIFTEGPKYLSLDGYLQANIIDLTPGQLYHFCVRPVEYNQSFFNPHTLPLAYDNLRFYPQTFLRNDISETDLIIPLLDVDDFPSSGIIQVGVELIKYSSIDTINKNIIVEGSTSGISAYFVDQGGPDGYAPPFIDNVGDGYIDNLTIISNALVLTEDWSILCVGVQRDSFNDPIPNTAKFSATGTKSGISRDGYGNAIVWTSNNISVSNGIFTFSIFEDTPTFQEGDGFLIKITGATLGLPDGRGYNNTIVKSHTVEGFDGYFTWDPTVRFYVLGEDQKWDKIFLCQSRFEYPNYQYTEADGYHQVLKDLLSTDLTDSDASNIDFPIYDYAGYHRTDPVLLLNGTCVGSYIGGEMGCIDKYGNYNVVRGLSLQDQNTQRQEIELSITGRDAILIRIVNRGITCSCYLPSSEYPDDRCPKCYGTKFVFGYEQYFNPRSPNGRIKIRPGPTAENLKMYEAGLESEFPLDMWTLTVPTIKTRDIIVLFDTNGINEEFRYEVSDVIRNNTILGQEGGQHLKTFRIRKFDPAYQVRIFRDSSDFPQKLNTSIGFVPGIPPHVHEIVISNKITSVSQINQTTSVVQGHNHPITGGIVQEVLGHSHTIILP